MQIKELYKITYCAINKHIDSFYDFAMKPKKPTSQDLRVHGKSKGKSNLHQFFWQQGGETNQIGALVVEFKKHQLLTTKALIDKLDNILGHIGSGVSLDVGFETLKKAVRKYNDQFGYSLKITDELTRAFQQKFDKRDIFLRPHEEIDYYRIADSYDTLSVAKKAVADTSQALLDMVDKQDESEFSCENIVIGAGDNAVTLWTEKFPDQHEAIREDIDKGNMPSVLVLAEGAGSWGRSNYMFEQSHSLLERPGEANPADFTRQETYESNARVNARHLAQANEIIRANTSMPILPSRVSAIEKKEMHATDWPDMYKDFEYRLKIQLNGEPGTTKTIYTNSIDICSGLGVARDVFKTLFDHKTEESAALHKKLTSYDETKGFTPLVSGNDFMLTPREEKKAHESNRRILVIGGGGGAAAVFRKAAFLEDTGQTFATIGDKDPPNTDIRWIARAGFGDVILAKQAEEAVAWGKRKGLLSAGTIIGVTQRDDGSIEATFNIYEEIEGGSELDSEELQARIKKLEHKAQVDGDMDFKIEKVTLSNVAQYVIVRKETVVCDQIVAAAGQDPKFMKMQFLSELGKLETASVDLAVTGVTSSDKKVHFHGAAAVALAEWSVSQSMQSDLHKASAPQDASVAGIMPPAREQVRASQNKGKDRDFLRHFNLNTVNPEFLAIVLKKGGLEEKEVTEFMAFVTTEKRARATGIDRKALDQYIKDNKLGGKIDVRGLASLAIKHILIADTSTAKQRDEVLLRPSADIPEIGERTAASPSVLSLMEMKKHVDLLRVDNDEGPISGHRK